MLFEIVELWKMTWMKVIVLVILHIYVKTTFLELHWVTGTEVH